MAENALIGQYQQVIDLGLRECRNRTYEPDRLVYSTYMHTYFVEYATLCREGRDHWPLHHMWHCIRDGFPVPGNLRKWVRKHEEIGQLKNADFIVLWATIRACHNSELICEWRLDWSQKRHV